MNNNLKNSLLQLTKLTPSLPPNNSFPENGKPKPKFKNRTLVQIKHHNFQSVGVYRLMGLGTKIVSELANKKLKVISSNLTTLEYINGTFKQEDIEIVYTVFDGQVRINLPESLLELYLDDETFKKLIEESVF